MAFNDDKIRIEVEGAQAAAQLEALAKEVQDLEAELETLNNTAGVTNAEIEGTTRRLGEAKAKFAEASEATDGFGKSTDGAGLSVKEMTKSIGAGLSILSILRDNFKALEPVLERNAQLLREYAVQAGASGETIDALSLAMDSFIHPSHIMENAIKATAEGAKLLQENIVGASEVIANVSDTIPQMLAKINEARKAAAEENKGSKKEEEDAAKSLAKEEEALEKAAVKSAEERAKAEAKAAAEIVATLEKERAALDAKLAQDEARLAKALGAGGKIDTSGEADAAKQDIAALRQEIKRLENQPMLDPAEQNKLNELKDQAAQAAASVRDLGKVFTQTADDFLTESEAADAAGAAWDVYGDRLQRAQNRHEDAIRTTEDADRALFEFGETATDAAIAAEDVAAAAGSIGDEAAKGADKGKEGLDKMTAGLQEAIPLAEQLRDLLQQIVTLGSQADI